MEKRLHFRRFLIGALCLVFVLSSVVGLKMITKKIYPIEYSEYVERYSKEFNIDKSLIYAVIYNESRFRPQAVSNIGAKGLMQITPDTFAWLQTKTKDAFEMDALYDPDINIRYGTLFLSLLQQEFGTRELVLSAYHAGRGSVNKWLCDPGISADGKNLDHIPFKDTDLYVNNVLKTEKIYKSIYKI